MIIDIISFLIAGLCAGMLSSIFGLGGGVVVVPVLYWIFRLHGMNPDEVMHEAVGSSLAVMVITTAGSLLGHYKNKNINFNFFKNMFPLVAVGSVIGAVSSRWLHSDVLRYFFVAFLVIVIIQALFNKGFTQTYEASDCTLPKKYVLWPVSFITGFISVLLGIGGSLFTVPFMRHCKSPMKQAAGTAVSLTPAVSILGSIGYMLAGLHSTNLPPHSIGYVNIFAFIFLSAGSLCGVPLGLKVGRKLSDKITAKVYLLLLVVILIAMLV